jgi:hypothetical protein
MGKERITHKRIIENGRHVQYIILDLGKGFELRFRPKWDEVLDLAWEMVQTEYLNKGNELEYIVQELKKTTKRAERKFRMLERETD